MYLTQAEIFWSTEKKEKEKRRHYMLFHKTNHTFLKNDNIFPCLGSFEFAPFLLPAFPAA